MDARAFEGLLAEANRRDAMMAEARIARVHALAERLAYCGADLDDEASCVLRLMELGLRGSVIEAHLDEARAVARELGA